MRKTEQPAQTKDRASFLLIILFILGLSVMLYPAMSEYWNSMHQSKAIANYATTVSLMDRKEYEAILEDAKDYNTRLVESENVFATRDFPEGYEDALNIDKTGIMGYVSINKLHVELPIYHGTDESTLQVAAGHLEGSSLPVGDVNSHCVISAHRGLPSAKLFTDLDRMEVGDTFTITVMNEEFTYMVDRIQIVEPKDLSFLVTSKNKAYCTLMTCTPYGINTHRMLVRGVRIANQVSAQYIKAEAYLVNDVLVALFLSIPILFISMCILVVVDKKLKRVTESEED